MPEVPNRLLIVRRWLGWLFIASVLVPIGLLFVFGGAVNEYASARVENILRGTPIPSEYSFVLPVAAGWALTWLTSLLGFISTAILARWRVGKALSPSDVSEDQ
jgi:hypothetical protein